MESICKTAEELKALAANMASHAKAGDVFAITGNLGAGKTTFAQGFINSLLEKEENITSPTFNIIQLYHSKKDGQGSSTPIYHCDLYRIKNINEAINLGIEDTFHGAITLIEWPEVAASILPRNTISIEIHTFAGDHRKVVVRSGV